MSDAQLANENAEDDRATAIRDTLLVARKFLIEHPEECKVPALSAKTSKFAGGGCVKGEHPEECKAVAPSATPSKQATKGATNANQ
jgi:hypothetical protein